MDVVGIQNQDFGVGWEALVGVFLPGEIATRMWVKLFRLELKKGSWIKTILYMLSSQT